MKFDQLCELIIEGKTKQEKFSRLVIGNNMPVFTREDIVKPNGTIQMYLSPKDKRDTDVDDERLIRRALRRLNWVARSAIKKIGANGDISIEKIGDFVRKLLEKYQTNVLKSTVNSALTGYETRVVLNLLLPPTKRNPHGKSVFIVPGMDPNATVEDADKPPKAPRVPRVPRSPREPRVPRAERVTVPTATGLYDRVMSIMDRMDEFFDADLKQTILDIIEDSEAGNEEGVDEPVTESVLVEGVTVRDIMNDPRIKGNYDPEIVRMLIKGMIGNNEIFKGEDDMLRIRTDEDPETGGMTMQRKFGSELDPTDEVLPDEEVGGVGKVDKEMEPTDGELDRIEADDEESDVNPVVDTDDVAAARRLGYNVSDESEETDEEEDEKPSTEEA